MQIFTIGKGQFALTEINETINRLIIIPDSWISDKVINAIHLHGYLFVYWNFATHYGITKLAVVNWRGRV